MKKLFLALSVVFALGMVACGSKDKPQDENANGVEEITDEQVVVEGAQTPQGEVEAAAVDVQQAGEELGEAAAQSAEEVKAKSDSKVQELKDKAVQKVSDAAEKGAQKVSDAAEKGAQKVSDAAKEAAEKLKK